MPEYAVFWNRVRRLTRPLGLPALPGWLFVVYEVAEKAHLMTSVAEHAGLATFLREYGWLVGIGWLFVVVLWEARKPRDAERRRARAMMQLQAATVDVLRRFEALCVSYEQTPAFPTGVSWRRNELLLSVASCLEAALSTMPARQRSDFEIMLFGARIDLAQYHDRDPRPQDATELPATLAIQRALEQLRKSRQPPAPPSVTPPSSTPSG
jgi:hypothetical protein